LPISGRRIRCAVAAATGVERADPQGEQGGQAGAEQQAYENDLPQGVEGVGQQVHARPSPVTVSEAPGAGASLSSQSAVTLEASTGCRRERSHMNTARAHRIANTTRTPGIPPIRWASAQQVAPTTAAHGRVMTHATTIRRATDQRTSAPLVPRPVPR